MMIFVISVAFGIFLQHSIHNQDLINYENEMIDRYCEKSGKEIELGGKVKVVYKCGNIERVKE